MNEKIIINAKSFFISIISFSLGYAYSLLCFAYSGGGGIGEDDQF